MKNLLFAAYTAFLFIACDKGKMTDPSRPGKECDFREVFTFIDDNTQKMEMYGPDSKTGKEYKTMEIKYTRKK